MRVLVTRPQPSAQKTAAKLTALGHIPVVVPLAEAVHDPEAIRLALSRQHSAIAVTSGEAIRALLSIGDALDRHLLTTVFAVGRASARAATNAGFRTVLVAEGGDGDSLADLIMAHRSDYGVPRDPLLYLAGSPRSKQFESRLDAAGIAHEAVECYRMEPIQPKRAQLRPALIDTPPDVVLLYSRESAVRFFELPLVAEYPECLQRVVFLCLSRQVASAVPSSLAANAVVSNTPTEDGLLDLL